MTYLDAMMAPVKTADRERYLAHARRAAEVFHDHGALRLVECWGDDVPHGKLTDMHRAVAAEEGETVVVSWILWPSKEARNRGMAAVMADPRLAGEEMPFDGRRMIFGGFEMLLDSGD